MSPQKLKMIVLGKNGEHWIFIKTALYTDTNVLSVKVYASRAPVHIITGSAGCQEGRDHFLNNQPKWSAFRSQDFGYTRFKAFNNSHIYMEQVSVDLNGEVIDSFWLVKNKTKVFLGKKHKRK